MLNYIIANWWQLLLAAYLGGVAVDARNLSYTLYRTGYKAEFFEKVLYLLQYPIWLFVSNKAELEAEERLTRRTKKQ